MSTLIRKMKKSFFAKWEEVLLLFGQCCKKVRPRFAVARRTCGGNGFKTLFSHESGFVPLLLGMFPSLTIRIKKMSA